MRTFLSALVLFALSTPSFAQTQGVSMRSTNGIGYGNTVIHNLIVTNAVTGNTVRLTNGNITASGNITNTGFSSTTTNYSTKLRVGGAAETADAVNVTGSVRTTGNLITSGITSASINASGTITTAGDVGVGNGRKLYFTSGPNYPGLSAPSTIVQALASATVIAPLQWNVPVQTKTTNYTITELESGTYFDNAGAGAAQTNTLPVTRPGTHFSFYVDAAQVLCISTNPASVDVIRYRTSVSGSVGNIFSSAVGSTIHIFCPKTNLWVVDQISAAADWTGPN